jgi:thiol peroxidase
MELTFAGNLIHTCGELPELGQKAPDFELTDEDLLQVSLSDYSGKNVILNIFPSVDTKVCASSVMHFNQQTKDYEDLIVLCISIDTPFALKRHCASFDFSHVTMLSDFRQRAFGKTYGLTIIDGPLAGVLARAVILLDKNHQVCYRDVAADISDTVNYQRIKQALDDLYAGD